MTVPPAAFPARRRSVKATSTVRRRRASPRRRRSGDGLPGGEEVTVATELAYDHPAARVPGLPISCLAVWLTSRVRRTTSRGDWRPRAEARRLAITYVYPRLAIPPICGQAAPAQTISQAYLDDAAPTVGTQLAKAAVRLAVVLRDALGR